MKEESKQSFIKNHADTIAIIGVNLAAMAILTTMWISNSHRIDACNSRIDATYQIILELLKEGRK
jgi:hypothetical protein